MRLGERLGLDTGPELATLYDVSMLTYVGCPVYGNEAALLFGDDIDFRAGTYDVDLARFRHALHAPPRRSGNVGARTGWQAGDAAHGHRRTAAWSSRWRTTARPRGCWPTSSGSPPTCGPASSSLVRAMGREGGARTVSPGEQLSLAARISHVADACEVLERTVGLESGRRGDPRRAAAPTSTRSRRRARERRRGICSTASPSDSVDELLELEPIERPPLTDEELDRALEAIGDFCDLRSPCFAGHARGTADLAAAAAAAVLQLSPAPSRRCCGAPRIVHDVGRFGVPGNVLGQARPA